jgi:hypothetical protein
MKEKESLLFAIFTIVLLLNLLFPLKILANGPSKALGTQAPSSDQAIEIEINVESLEGRITELEIELAKTKKFQEIIKLAEKKLSQYEVEKIAIDKLVEISEKNFKSQEFIVWFIFGTIGIISALFAYVGNIIRKSLIKDYEFRIESIDKEHIEKYKNISDKHKNDLKDLKVKFEEETEKLRLERLDLLRETYAEFAFVSWELDNYNKALTYAERAKVYAQKRWTEPTEEEKKKLIRMDSELAYFYAEAGRKDKAEDAINFAKRGLEVGISDDNPNLIDNYLYVIFKLPHSDEDEKNWIEIYEKYGKQLHATGIRDDKEIKEFEEFYEKAKKSQK